MKDQNSCYEVMASVNRTNWSTAYHVNCLDIGDMEHEPCSDIVSCLIIARSSDFCVKPYIKYFLNWTFHIAHSECHLGSCTSGNVNKRLRMSFWHFIILSLGVTLWCAVGTWRYTVTTASTPFLSRVKIKVCLCHQSFWTECLFIYFSSQSSMDRSIL